MLFSFANPIWLYPKPVDFRKQMDGLVMLVADHLKLNPLTGQLFLFRNRESNKIKLLWWDRNGFWLCYKRLEKGKFKFPEISCATVKLTQEQLGWLLSGLDFTKHQLLPEVTVDNYY
jgi:transposase